MAAWPQVLDAVESLRMAVREGRRRDRVSLRELAARTGVPFNSISRFENGGDILLSNAVALMRWLAGNTDQSPPGRESPRADAAPSG